MAGIEDIGSPEASDDDTVSLTSTMFSEEQARYEVEAILAEINKDGEMLYLTKWQGYEDYANTWEPKENFDQDTTFKDWQERKMRISRGREKPFSVEAWKASKRRHEAETEARRRRRREKKKRMNIEVDDSLSSSDPSSTSEENSEEDSPVEPSPVQEPPLKRPRTLERKRSSATASRKVWTDPEQNALLKGLQDANGPRWGEILGWYGHHGSRSEILKDRTLLELQHKIEAIKLEFSLAGRDPPLYLMPAEKESGIQITARKSQITTAPNGVNDSKIHNDIKSPSSLMKEHKNPQAAESPLHSTKNPQRRAQMEEEHKIKSTAPKVDAQGSNLFTKLHPQSAQQSPKRGQPRTAWTGTAKTSAETHHDPPPNLARMGNVGRGPARLGPPKPKAKLKKSDARRKPAATGLDVAAKWNAEPKLRHSKLDSEKADVATQKASQLFSKLSTRHRVFKRQRNERAPDRSQLVFLDNKGKALKRGSFPTTPVTPNEANKIPLEPHQEEETLREAENDVAVESENQGAKVNGEKVETPVENRKTAFQVYRENLAAKEAESNAFADLAKHGAKANAENEAISPETDTICAIRPNLDTRLIGKSDHDSSGSEIRGQSLYAGPSDTSPVTSTIAPLANMSSAPLDHSHEAPVKPKLDRTSTDSTTEYQNRSNSNIQPPVNSVARPYPRIETAVTQPSALGQSLSSFTLIANPTPVQRLNLTQLRDPNPIFGELIVPGEGRKKAIRVKFIGLDWYTSRLLLTIKVEPLTLHFRFETMCTASDYLTYFTFVSRCK